MVRRGLTPWTIRDLARWERERFGFGYGSGETHVLGALMTFGMLLHEGRSYDYREVEAQLGGPAAWLLINALLHSDMLNYGTSPRCGWLNDDNEDGPRLFGLLAEWTDADALAGAMCAEQRRMDVNAAVVATTPRPEGT